MQGLPAVIDEGFEEEKLFFSERKPEVITNGRMAVGTVGPYSRAVHEIFDGRWYMALLFEQEQLPCGTIVIDCYWDVYNVRTRGCLGYARYFGAACRTPGHINNGPFIEDIHAFTYLIEVHAHRLTRPARTVMIT